MVRGVLLIALTAALMTLSAAFRLESLSYLPPATPPTTPPSKQHAPPLDWLRLLYGLQAQIVSSLTADCQSRF